MATQIHLFVVSLFSLPTLRFFRREAPVRAATQSKDKRCTNCYSTHTHTHTHTHRCMNCCSTYTPTHKKIHELLLYTHTHTQTHELLFHIHNTHTQRCMNCYSTHTCAHAHRYMNCYPYTHTHPHPHFLFPSPFTRQDQVDLRLMPWYHFFGGVNGDASTSCSEQLRKTMNPDCSLHL